MHYVLCDTFRLIRAFIIYPKQTFFKKINSVNTISKHNLKSFIDFVINNCAKCDCLIYDKHE